MIATLPGARQTYFTMGLPQQRPRLVMVLRTLRAARDVPIDRNEFIHAMNVGIDGVHPALVGAGAHGDQPFRLQHLFVETLNNRRHFGKAGSRGHQQVRLKRVDAQNFCTKTHNVMHRRN